MYRKQLRLSRSPIRPRLGSLNPHRLSPRQLYLLRQNQP
jgi:hypothetical protein